MSINNPSPNAERLAIKPVSRKVLLIGALLLAAPPPRVFLTIASDALQVMTLLAAVGGTMLVLVATYQPESDWAIDEEVAERKGNTLDLFRERIQVGFNAVIAALLAILVGKSLVLWIGTHGMKVIVDRLVALLVGLALANAFERAKGMLDLLGYIHVGRNMSLYLRGGPFRVPK